jgi:predicted secreted protein
VTPAGELASTRDGDPPTPGYPGRPANRRHGRFFGTGANRAPQGAKESSMYVNMHNPALPESGRAVARISMAIAVALALYFGLVVGTRWTLFEAPQLPEAVAASPAATRCATTPEFARTCESGLLVPAFVTRQPS